LQNQAIAASRDAFLKAGWTDVVVLDAGDRFQTWEHVQVSKKDGGRVYIEVRGTGEVITHKGFVTTKEHERRLKKDVNGSEKKDDAELRPELTKAAQNYLDLHRHAAVRHSLLNHPSIALRLMVAHAIGGSGLWRTKPDPQRADKEEIADSVSGSKAANAFAKEREPILKMLGLPAHGHSVVRSNGDDYRVVSLFVTLLKLSDKEVMRAMAYVMAETLQAGTSVVEALGCHLKIDMADYWKPDETFFTLPGCFKLSERKAVETFIPCPCDKNLCFKLDAF